MRRGPDRRSVLRAGAAVLAATSPAAAQAPARPRTLGLLSPLPAAESAPWQAGLTEGLAKLGWAEGSNLVVARRYADGNSARLPALAAELMAANADILVTELSSATLAARKATSTLPIVMVSGGDPVASGLAASLARPGGNVTGVSQNIVELSSKRLELLKHVRPDLADVAVLWMPDDGNSSDIRAEIDTASRRLGLRLHFIEVADAASLAAALARDPPPGCRALYIVPVPLFGAHMAEIAHFARAHGLPSIFNLPEFVRTGGLLSYGPNRREQYRRAAAYVDRILHGARPADLPIEQPDVLDLAVNLATARAIGLTLPPLVLSTASEVVE
jgi:putative ABC transport system substrate-binding protein